MANDAVNHPSHYADNKINGYECKDVTRYAMFLSGNVIKYCWRAGFKINTTEDLDKAEFYLNELRNEYAISELRELMEVAGELDKGEDLTHRQIIIVGIVTSLYNMDYNRTETLIKDLRSLLNEDFNHAPELSIQSN